MGLFSTTIHKHTSAPAYPQTVNVHQPAPPDQLRLVREIEDTVAARMTVEGLVANHVTGRVSIYRDVSRRCQVSTFSIRINGVDVTVDHVEHDDNPTLNATSAREEFLDKITYAVGKAALRGLDVHLS